jgi:uncharacterized repeat protein (TIGR01451 family)
MGQARLHRLNRLAAALSAAVVMLAAHTGVAVAAGSPPSQLVFDHSNTKCQSVDSNHNLQKSPQMSQTGIALINGDLFISCWGDTTITEINPLSPSTEVAVYTISAAPYKAFGALAYDPTDNLLWACASTNNAGTGSPENQMSEVGTISLNGGNDTGTFTPWFDASHNFRGTQYSGCDNGLAWDPGSESGRADTLWTSGDLDTVEQNWTPNVAKGTAAWNTAYDVKSLMGASPATSGIVFGGGKFYIANQQTTTKRVYSVKPDFSGYADPSEPVLSSSHRYEDMECDDQTYNTTVIWVMWFNQNILKPLPISGTCGTSPPPPTLSISQSSDGPVTAGQNVDFTDTVANTGSAGQTNVTVTQPVPANAIFVSVTPSTGGVCSNTASVISCSFATLAANQSDTMKVTFTTMEPGTVTSQATAQSDQASPVSASAPATVTATPSVIYYTVTDTSIAPVSTSTQPLGDSVQFAVESSATHELTDGLGVLDSGPLTAPTNFDWTFTAGGKYTVTDTDTSHATTVNVPPQSPINASLNSPFQVTWATSMPGGCTENVQVLTPGTTTWVAWIPKATQVSGMYTPTQSGTYQFRSKLVCGSAFTQYSPGTSTTVS